MPGEKRGVAGSAVLLFESDSIWEEKRQPNLAGDFLLFRNVEFDKVMQLRSDALLKRAATFCTNRSL
ncbi:MAG: hypothetical protein K0R28_6261 [Paenibacillus sp.]|jgi:hypothetical protein|nr:hypothetical protein [Paenibacillus sp.]